MRLIKWILFCTSPLLFAMDSFPFKNQNNLPIEEPLYEQPLCCYSDRVGFVEGKVGYFYPFSGTLRSIIHEGVDFQLSFTYKVWKMFAVFTSADFFIKKGHSTGDHSETKVWILPITLGLKLFATIYKSDTNWDQLDFYFAIAPRWYLSRATNRSPFLDHHNFAQGIGGMTGIGFIYSCKDLSFSVFTEASYGNIHSHTSKPHLKTPNTQVGGLLTGGSLGYNF